MGLTVFFASCSSDKQLLPDVYVLDLQKSQLVKAIRLSDIADSVFYVTLSNDVVVGNITNLQIQDSIFFIHTTSNLLYAFDIEGQFTHMIGNHGQGPTDYFYSIDFSIDSKHGRIFVHSDRNEITVYSYEGIFLNRVRVAQRPDGWEETVYMQNHLYLFEAIPPYDYPQSNLLWSVVDSIGNVTAQHHFYEQFPTQIARLTHSRSNIQNNDIIYWNHFNDTVFAVNTAGAYPLYVWVKDENWLKPTDLDPRNLFSSTGSQNKYMILSFFDTPHFLYIKYRYDKYYVAFYHKLSKQMYHMPIISKNENPTLVSEKTAIGLTNDIDGGIYFLPNYYGYIAGEPYFIQILQPESLLRLKERPNKPFSPELLDLRQRIHEEDNPILMMVRLKKQI